MKTLKALIVGATLAGLAWYFLIKEKPVKQPAIAGGNGSGGTGTGNGGGSANPQDAIVLKMIDDIMAAYPGYSSSEQFSDARTMLYNASQPVVTPCLMAPCPAIAQVSKVVEDKAKALIDILDQKLQYNMTCKGTACMGGANMSNDNTPVDLGHAAMGLNNMLALEV